MARSFDLEAEILRLGGKMMSYDEFYSILKKCLYDSLNGFSREEIDAYLNSDAFELRNIKEGYEQGMENFKTRQDNMAFYGQLSRLDNLLSLCFE